MRCIKPPWRRVVFLLPFALICAGGRSGGTGGRGAAQEQRNATGDLSPPPSSVHGAAGSGEPNRYNDHIQTADFPVQKKANVPDNKGAWDEEVKVKEEQEESDEEGHEEEIKLIIDADPAGLTWSGLDVDDDLALLALLAVAAGCED
jgi:hypothetical protein